MSASSQHSEPGEAGAVTPSVVAGRAQRRPPRVPSPVDVLREEIEAERRANRDLALVLHRKEDELRNLVEQYETVRDALQEARDYIADDDPGEADTAGFHSSFVGKLDAALRVAYPAMRPESA